MSVKRIGTFAAGAVLTGALLFPTAAFAAPGDDGVIGGPGTGVITITSDDQLRVGVNTGTDDLNPGQTIDATWYRGATVVATTTDYTPVEADRGRLLSRVADISFGGEYVMTIRVDFSVPVA